MTLSRARHATGPGHKPNSDASVTVAWKLCFAELSPCRRLARSPRQEGPLRQLGISPYLLPELRMLGRLHAARKTGAEAFTRGDIVLGFTVLDFWQWSSSDLVGNALRGHVAEFLVSRAVGAISSIRNEWDS